MIRVRVKGKVTLDFVQVLEIPEDEIGDFVFDGEGESFDEDNITANIDLNQAIWDIDEYDQIEVKVL